MSQQQSTPRRSVALAAAFVLVASAAFAAAFYLYDGTSLVSDLIAAARSAVPTSSPAPPAKETTATAELELPDGMPESFALRLWQEQVDSQDTIGKLVAGDITGMDVSSVESDGPEATLHVVVKFKDGTSAPGHLGMRRFDDVWYIASASGARKSNTGGDADIISKGGFSPTPVPALASVDIPLLNTILSQQRKSARISREYVDGKVSSLSFGAATRGPHTVTLKVKMNEDHEESYANVVVIEQKVEGEPVWFIARFLKTGSEPIGK